MCTIPLQSSLHHLFCRLVLYIDLQFYYYYIILLHSGYIKMHISNLSILPLGRINPYIWSSTVFIAVRFCESPHIIMSLNYSRNRIANTSAATTNMSIRSRLMIHMHICTRWHIANLEVCFLQRKKYFL